MEIITGIATIVLVLITAIYVYLTWRLLRATDKPEIAVSLRFNETTMSDVMLCIENIGIGAARSVQFKTDLSFRISPLLPLEDIGVLKDGIAYFEPRHKILSSLGNPAGKWTELKQTPLEIEVTYKGSAHYKGKGKFHLDFGELEGLSPNKSPLFGIAQSTKAIDPALAHLTAAVQSISGALYNKAPLGLPLNALELEKRIDGLPNEVQQEILQEVEVIISKKEQEVRKGEQNEQTTTENL